MMKNYMEIIVGDVLEDMLTKRELKCDCERCVEDIKAITLNSLKPMYVVSDKGIVYNMLSEMDIQFRADVIRQITIAIGKVENTPRH